MSSHIECTCVSYGLGYCNERDSLRSLSGLELLQVVDTKVLSDDCSCPFAGILPRTCMWMAWTDYELYWCDGWAFVYSKKCVQRLQTQGMSSKLDHLRWDGVLFFCVRTTHLRCRTACCIWGTRTFASMSFYNQACNTWSKLRLGWGRCVCVCMYWGAVFEQWYTDEEYVSLQKRIIIFQRAYCQYFLRTKLTTSYVVLVGL